MYGPKGAKRFFRGEKEITAEEYAALGGRSKIADLLRGAVPPGGTHAKGWPMRSVALACQPSQVADMNARNKRLGIGTRYEGDGTAVIPDAADRRRLIRQERLVDRDSFI